MPLFRALAKNMAASYFGESALRFCNGSYTSVCLYSVAEVSLPRPIYSQKRASRNRSATDLLNPVVNKPISGCVRSPCTCLF
jgi:hypothetical protein